jgi:hypothetical protein
VDVLCSHLVDPIIRHSDEKSFEELRNEFRSQNLKRIRAMLRKDSLVRYRKDGSVAGRLETGLMTDAPQGRDWRSTKDYLASGEVIPDFTDEFVVVTTKGLERDLEALADDAKALFTAEKVTRPTSPIELGTLDSTDDAAVLKYIDDNVPASSPGKESDGKAATEGEWESAGPTYADLTRTHYPNKTD